MKLVRFCVILKNFKSRFSTSSVKKNGLNNFYETIVQEVAIIRYYKSQISSSYNKNFVLNLKMKVVIPSTGCREKNMVFSTPHDEFCISGHDIWGEGT